MIDRFLDMADVPASDREQLENKIIVTINPNMFKIDLVKLTKQKKEIDDIEKEARAKEFKVALEKHQKLSEVERSEKK